jgi:hypothetical protein
LEGQAQEESGPKEKEPSANQLATVARNVAQAKQSQMETRSSFMVCFKGSFFLKLGKKCFGNWLGL